MDEKKRTANLVLPVVSGRQYSFSMCAPPRWGEFFTAPALQIAFCLLFSCENKQEKETTTNTLALWQDRAAQINKKVCVFFRSLWFDVNLKFLLKLLFQNTISPGDNFALAPFFRPALFV